MPDATTGARTLHPMSTNWSKSKHKEYAAPLVDQTEEAKGEMKVADNSAIEETKEEVKSASEVGKKRTF